MGLRYNGNIYFYNKNLKNLFIAFLNLFSDIYVKRYNSETGIAEQTVKVPILLNAIERSSYMNSKGETVQRLIELPLIHFNLDSMDIDKDRTFPMKSLHLYDTKDNKDLSNLMPVPYNYQITMTIFAKYQEDIVQLIEQIIPIFNYHRVVYYEHPIFSDKLTISNWVSITGYPSFTLNSEYEASERRGIMSSQTIFKVEGWMVREAYESGGVIKDIITNYNDYVTLKGLERVRLVGDPSIRDLHLTRQGLTVLAVGNIIQGNRFGCIITQIISQSNVIVKFPTELEAYMDGESLKIGNTTIGTSFSCEIYDLQPIIETITVL